MSTWKILWGATKLALKTPVMAAKIGITAAEATYWVGYGTVRTAVAGKDALVACTKLGQSKVRCPQGHQFQTEGEIYECSACHLIYNGSIWLCPNPHCQSVTPYANCPTCGLSVRNPFLLGRP